MAVTESKVGSYDETNNIIFIDSSKIDGTPIPDSNIGDAVAMIGASTYSSLGEAKMFRMQLALQSLLTSSLPLTLADIHTP